MVDPKPLLKLFGDTADVITQVATDKSTNARRPTATTSGMTGGADPSKGQLIEGVQLDSGGTTSVPHGLGRTAVGAIVLTQTTSSAVVCTGADDSQVTLVYAGTPTVTLWVF